MPASCQTLWSEQWSREHIVLMEYPEHTEVHHTHWTRPRSGNTSSPSSCARLDWCLMLGRSSDSRTWTWVDRTESPLEESDQSLAVSWCGDNNSDLQHRSPPNMLGFSAVQDHLGSWMCFILMKRYWSFFFRSWNLIVLLTLTKDHISCCPHTHNGLDHMKSFYYIM